MGLLLALLKVTIKLMHKLAPAVGEMLKKKGPDHSVDKESVFDWLDFHKGGTLLEKSEWTEGQLTELERSCQNLLTNGTHSYNKLFIYASFSRHEKC